ncbi:MAG: WD40 repeat domain-containing protein, partial [Pirellulaceae bacterium]|nr:WD40 repeat domain-containing protein [Pirellulaceae bacterium]
MCNSRRAWPGGRFTIFLCLQVLIAGGHIDAQAPGPAGPLVGHTAAMNAAVYSGDQRYLVTAGADQAVKIWNARTGDEIRTLSGHTGQVLCLATSPDNAVLVSGAADNTLRMWDVPQPDPLRVFASSSPTRAVAVSPNGQWAVSFGDDLAGRIWKLEDGGNTLVLEGHAAQPLVAAVRNDNNQIASGDSQGTILTWGPLDGKLQGHLGAHAGPVRGLAFHPNNQQLVSAGDDGLVKYWQLPPAGRRSLDGHSSVVRGVALTSDGQLALLGGDDSVRVFNVGNGQPLRELAGASGPTAAVAVSGNNAPAAIAGR